MRRFRRYSLAKYIVIFILVQLAWLAVLGLWIARYVVSHVTFKEIGQRYAIQIGSGGDIAMLVIGLVLIAAGIAGMSVMFRYLNLHFRQTRLYDNFMASITHELKTPLASIRLNIDTLNRYQDVTPEQSRGFLAQMHQEAGRLERLIGAVLEVDRLENGYAHYKCKILEADRIIKSLFEKLGEQYGLSSEQAQISGALKSQIVIDPNALRVVFENLFENSIKYSSDALRINIYLDENEKQILVAFRDYGIGVPQNHLKKIFKKFYQVRVSHNPSVKGTGLGLYLVKGIVVYHGGRICAAQPDDGHGLVIRIELPAYPQGNKRLFRRLLEEQE